MREKDKGNEDGGVVHTLAPTRVTSVNCKMGRMVGFETLGRGYRYLYACGTVLLIAVAVAMAIVLNGKEDTTCCPLVSQSQRCD